MSFLGPLIGLGRALFGSALADQIAAIFFGGNQGAVNAALEGEVKALAGLDASLAKLITNLAESDDQLWVLVTQLAADQKSWWRRSRNTTSAIGVMIDGMSKDFSGAIINIIDNYVPNTMQNFEEWAFKHWIDGIYKVEAIVIRRVDAIEQFENDFKGWRASRVDPDLASLDRFQAFFNTWPIDVLNTLRNWIAHPDQFAHFLVFDMMLQLSNTIENPAHKTLYDEFVGAIVLRTPDVSAFVVDSATAILNEQV